MNDAMPLKFVFLTLADDGAVLNAQTHAGENHRFKLTRDDLLRLNSEIADALLKRGVQS